MNSIRTRGLLRSCALAALLAVGASASADVVTSANTGDWTIYEFNGPATVLADAPGVNSGFENGPASPPAGTGSFFGEVTAANAKAILQTDVLHGLSVAGINELSFWTYIDPTSTNLNDWYANVYVDKDGDSSTNDRVRLDFTPSGVVTGLWQQFNITAGTVLVSGGGGLTTFAAFAAANPNAVFNAFNQPVGGGSFRLNIGDTSTTYVGFSGNLDAVVIDHDALGRTTYDFEATSIPTPTAAAGGMILLSALATRRRRPR